MGIHTGLVVAGEMGGRDRREPVSVVGETPNIAARVQGEAEPDTVVVSADTRRLVEGRFDFADLGPREMKGVMGPVALFRVIGERAAAPRTRTSTARRGRSSAAARRSSCSSPAGSRRARASARPSC